MFGLFLKYNHSFYVTDDLLKKISTNDIVTKKNNFFLSSNSIKISERQIKITQITNILFYVSLKFKTEKELIISKKYIEKFKTFLPPWSVFPDLFQGSPRWNQGYEEDYCINYWVPFWKKLDLSQKKEYKIKYNCPDEWSEWLEKNINVL